MVQPIPEPHVLDPDRILSDEREDFTAEEHRSRAQQLDAALHESCAYGKQLWVDVARARQYLYDSLPPDPRHPAVDRVGAAPTGPDDEQGWQCWIDAYSELTSVLVGPQGDSGLGVKEARAAAQLRRNAPNARLRAAHPTLMHELAPDGGGPAGAQALAREPDPQFPAAGSQASSPRSATARRVAVGVLALLALRGMRLRRPAL